MMNPQRYARSAMSLHWIIALALAFQLGLGWRLGGMAKGLPQFAAYQLHELLAFLTVGLFLLHVIGGLRHQFIKHENVLGRMVPLFARMTPLPHTRSTVIAIVAVGAMGIAIMSARAINFGANLAVSPALSPSLPAVMAPVTPASQPTPATTGETATEICES